MDRQIVLVVDNVRSALNVGSLFRTSDGAGVGRIILCGYTPSPIDRFGRTQNQIAKTSLGASEMVPWEKAETTADACARVQELKANGFTIVAVEQTENAIPLHAFTVPQKVAYIVGNEIDGVSQELLELCDQVVEIPMRGKKESLNVGVAAGIALFKV